MMHMSTGFPLNFTVNRLSPSRQTLSTQLAVVLSNIIAMPRSFSVESIILKLSLTVILSRPSCLTYSQNIPNQAISCFTFSRFSLLHQGPNIPTYYFLVKLLSADSCCKDFVINLPMKSAVIVTTEGWLLLVILWLA